MEIRGRVVSISLPIDVGTIIKTECIIETSGQYPKKVCIDFIGDKQNLLKGSMVEKDATISIDIKSREYNGKWYTNITGYKILIVE